MGTVLKFTKKIREYLSRPSHHKPPVVQIYMVLIGQLALFQQKINFSLTYFLGGWNCFSPVLSMLKQVLSTEALIYRCQMIVEHYPVYKPI